MKSKVPSRIALEVENEFRASHTLEGFEVLHFHLWKISVQFEAKLPLANDRLIDLIFLQTKVDEVLAELRGTHLNDTLTVSPTSENVALWLWDRVGKLLPDAPLHHVQVKLCDLEGRSTGTARVSQ